MNSLMQKAEVAYGWFVKAANSLQSPFLLLIRLYWGWQFWQAGMGHLNNMAKFIDFFTGLGIPAPALNAHFVALLEAGGGILLALGLGSRIISLLLAGDMFVAFITADREALSSIFTDVDKFYAAAPYTFLFAALIILIFGPGKLALDTLVAAWWKKRSPSSAAAHS
ncbi:MAG TPA: DoxX family protein [Candidatus Angelobacter sp.]|jgi:putative oxidoreductase